MGLEVDPSAPLFGYVGRLEDQKGVDVILAALPQLLGRPAPGLVNPHTNAATGAAVGCSFSVPESVPGTQADASESSISGGSSRSSAQVVMLGQGQAWQEACLRQLDLAWPGQAVGFPTFNEQLAHLIMAGCDFLLVPSRFEPCGLVALCGIRYATIPIVPPVGGLHDVIRAGGVMPQGGRGVAAAPAGAPETAAGSAAGCAVASGRGSGAAGGGGGGCSTVQQLGQAGAVAAAAAAAAAPAARGTGQGPDLDAGGASPMASGCGGSSEEEGLLGYELPTIGPSNDAAALRAAVDGLVHTMLRAVADYGSSRFVAMRRRCMAHDVSWGPSADSWEQVLMRLVAKRSSS